MRLHASTRPMALPMLSVEEQAIADDEHSEATISLDKATDDVDRLADTAAVTTDVGVVLDNVPDANADIEKQLIATVAEMAVAGTDGEAEDISMATSGEPDGLSNESFVDTLMRLWQALVRGVKNMWVNLKHWVTTYFSTVDRAKAKAQALLERAKALKVGGHIETAVHMPDTFGYGNKGSEVEIANNVGKNLKVFQDSVPSIAKLQQDTAKHIGGILNNMFAKYDGSTEAIPELSKGIGLLIRDMNEYAKALNLARLHKVGNVQHAAKSDVYNFPFLNIGANTLIMAKHLTVDMRQADDASVDENITSLAKIRFTASIDTDVVSNNDIRYALKGDVHGVGEKVSNALIKPVLTMAEILIHIRSSSMVEMEKIVQRVDQTCEAMLKRVGAKDHDAVTRAKRLMQLSPAFSNWATQPTTKLMSIAARHMAFWLSLAEKSIIALEAASHAKPEEGAKAA